MEERLLGYDAREMWLDFKVEWDQCRKEISLLREDIQKPLSTDTMVWDEVTKLCKIKQPKWIGANDIWEDLGKLEKFVDKHRQKLMPHWIIAITWLCEANNPYRSKYDVPYLTKVYPCQVQPTWEFLGYDISDMWLLSGLTNCGYTAPDDINKLKNTWSKHFNSYHLFEDFNKALEFRDLTDQRVPEHSPFSVFGIYRVHKSII